MIERKVGTCSQYKLHCLFLEKQTIASNQLTRLMLLKLRWFLG